MCFQNKTLPRDCIHASSTIISAMPRKWKSTISCLQNLQAGEDISSPKQQKSMEPDPDLSDGIEEMKSEDDVVHLKYLGDS